MSDYPGELDPLNPPPDAQALSQAQHQQLNYRAPDEAERHRARRERQIKLSLITAIVTRPISFVLPLITVPLFYAYLGKERYGLYESIGALAMYIGMTNAGLTLGLVNRLTECHVRDDRSRAQRYVSSLTPALLAMAFLALLILSLITPLVPWTRVFKVDSPVAAREIPWSFWLAGLLTVAGFLAGLPGSIYAAYQETHRNNYWDAAAKIASLLACFAVVKIPGMGIVGVVLAISGVQTLVRLVNLADLLYREKPFLRPRISFFDRRMLRTLLGDGILLFALQMSAVLLYQSDKLIIGIGLTPDDVAGYAILGRIFLTSYGVYMMLLVPLWPASGEALRRGDNAWLRRSLRFSMLIGVAMMAATGIALLVFTEPVLRHIKGAQGLTISRSLILAMTLTFVLRAWVDCRSIILNSASVLLPQIYFYTGHAVLNLLVAILVVRRFGVEGVAWSTAITAIVTVGWAYPWLIRRYIFRSGTPAPAKVSGGVAPAEVG
jgi:O-antigen/teichoic acid export membrane protein